MRGKKLVQLALQNLIHNEIMETVETDQNFVNSFGTLKQINNPNSEVQSTDDIFTASCDVPVDTISDNHTISTASTNNFTILSSCTYDGETNIINNDILFSLNSSNTLIASTDGEMTNSIIEFDVLAKNDSVSNNYNATNEIISIESPVDNPLTNVESTESPIKKRKVTLSFDEDPDYIPNDADESHSGKIDLKFIVINELYNYHSF